jgi:MFS family permease
MREDRFYNFVEDWAIDTHLPTQHLNVVYLLPIINATSCFGRVLPNFISDYIGPLNVQSPAMFLAGLLVFFWLLVRRSLPALLVIALLYGFFSGAAVGLPPAAVASLTEDMSRFGARMGVVFMAMGLASLIGNPVAGALVQGEGGYDGARVWAGCTMVAGASLMALGRVAKTGWVVQAKA